MSFVQFTPKGHHFIEHKVLKLRAEVRRVGSGRALEIRLGLLRDVPRLSRL
jgi:hypothetical protein